MIEIGRVATKIAGRDAGKKCVIVEVLDNNYVMIEGETRRRKCNIAHLDLLDQVIKIKKSASKEEIAKELGIKAVETKPKSVAQRPRRLRGKKKAKPSTETSKKAATKKGKTAKKKEPKKEEEPKSIEEAVGAE